MDDGYELFGMDSFAEEIWTDIVEGEKRNARQREQVEVETTEVKHTVYSADRIRELEAEYADKMTKDKPNVYTGRAMYMARLHHLVELADNTIHIHWLSGKDAKNHKFLVFAPTGKGKLSELVFDMVMTERFSFGQATMGDSNCGAVTRDRFESQREVEEHIKDRIARLTGQTVDIK